MTKLNWCAVFSTISLIFANAALAQPATGLQSKLIGHWKLESIDLSGEKPYGAKPQGAMYIDTTGHYSVIVISDGGARSLAYFGSYKTNDAAGTVTYHIDDATQTTANGRNETRLVSFNGDELVQQSLPAPGRPVLKVVWKRS